MSTNHTTNYNLNQWEAADKVLRAEFNADNAKIDAALKASADAIGALEGQMAGKGNCQLYVTSYAGTGQYGQAHPQSLTFPKLPRLVILGSSNGHLMFFGRGQSVVTGIQLDHNEPCFWTQVTWTGNTVSWYGESAAQQMNYSGFTYYALAFLDAGE